MTATIVADGSLGRISARHLVSVVGYSTGRAPACAHVFAGGGVYGLAFQGVSSWRPGASLSAGIDVPTGDHGAIQFDAALHLIAARTARPIASSTLPALSLLVGWSYRF